MRSYAFVNLTTRRDETLTDVIEEVSDATDGEYSLDEIVSNVVLPFLRRRRRSEMHDADIERVMLSAPCNTGLNSYDKTKLRAALLTAFKGRVFVSWGLDRRRLKT